MLNGERIELFTPQPDRVALGDIGLPPDTLNVSVDENAHVTAREWVRIRGGDSTDSRVEDVVIDGRPAVRVVNGVFRTEAIFVADGDTIFSVGYAFDDDALSREAHDVLMSLHILTTAERRAVPSPTPDARPARPATSVADRLADGFARRDVAALASVLAACADIYVERGGIGAKGQAIFLDELRDDFARGLSVSVQARPLRPGMMGDTAGALAGMLTLDATWRYPGQAPRRIDLVLGQEGLTWSWTGTVWRAGN